MNLLSIFQEIGISDLVDIVLMSLLIYAILVWFKRRRAAFVLFGIIICGLAYLLANRFHLLLMSTLLQAFFTVILVALVIIFQEEFKYFFEQIAVWSLNRKFRKKTPSHSLPKVVDTLVKTLTDLAQARIGALIVIPGTSIVGHYLEGGFDLNGEISEPLLKSIFDPHSVGHDGGVVIEQDRVVRFGCQLPLSKDFSKNRRGGMRHAAALGLAERTDALCLVVSEETGMISAAIDGELIALGGHGESGQVRNFLEKFYAETVHPVRSHRFRDLMLRNPREKLLAVLLTIGLWYAVVHESRVVHKTFVLPVEYTQPAADLYVESVEPREVRVTFSGPRYIFRFLKRNDIRALIRLHNYGEGTWAVPVSETNITPPKDTVLDEIDPSLVLVEIEKK